MTSRALPLLGAALAALACATAPRPAPAPPASEAPFYAAQDRGCFALRYTAGTEAAWPATLRLSGHATAPGASAGWRAAYDREGGGGVGGGAPWAGRWRLLGK